MKYGCIGEHLKHSFSKEIHAEIANYEYEIREIPRDDLDVFMTDRDFLGINVTIPYKELVIPHLYYVHPDAERIGAVNTVVNRDGMLYGYNTDFYGMSCLISHAGAEIQDKKVIILGTGGTSKTASAVAHSLGAREVIRVSRTARDGAVDYDTLYSQHADAEIIINTTPVGMYPNTQSTPVDISRFENLEAVIDAVYNPLSTQLVASARERGIIGEGGLYMLVAQAIRASEIFLNVSYDKSLTDEVYSKIFALKENVVLIGMPASGKSTVGRFIARLLGREFIDSDDEIKRLAGCEIPEIFKKYGEAHFRNLESEAVAEISKRSGVVIATGGGAVLRQKNVEMLKQNGRLYFIDRPTELLIPTDNRPLSRDKASIEKLYSERYPIYSGVCDKKIDGSADVAAVAEKILEDFRK